MTSVRQAARAAATSARSCSLACRVFFPPQAGAPQRPAQHGGAEPPPHSLGQHRGVLGQRGVGPLGHQRAQHLRSRTAQCRRPTPATQRRTPALAHLPQPAIHRANRNPEPLGQDALAALAPLMRGQHTLPQIHRQRHGSRTSKAMLNAASNQPFKSGSKPL
jgi:hypothetical protein